MEKELSLEQAYAKYTVGLLDAKSAYFFSMVAECECGNAEGTLCFQSRHQEMRDTLKYALEQQPHRAISEYAWSPCDVCACVGCSEGNCCEHEHV
jgi:hypothetical protein